MAEYPNIDPTYNVGFVTSVKSKTFESLLDIKDVVSIIRGESSSYDVASLTKRIRQVVGEQRDALKLDAPAIIAAIAPPAGTKRRGCKGWFTGLYPFDIDEGPLKDNPGADKGPYRDFLKNHPSVIVAADSIGGGGLWALVIGPKAHGEPEYKTFFKAIRESFPEWFKEAVAEKQHGLDRARFLGHDVHVIYRPDAIPIAIASPHVSELSKPKQLPAKRASKKSPYRRFTIAEWEEAWPHFKPIGGQLKAPCPACAADNNGDGGNDRLVMSQGDDGTAVVACFVCCPDGENPDRYKEILLATFGEQVLVAEESQRQAQAPTTVRLEKERAVSEWAYRLLQKMGSTALIAYDEEGKSKVYLSDDTGIWRNDESRIAAMVHIVADEWRNKTLREYVAAEANKSLNKIASIASDAKHPSFVKNIVQACGGVGREIQMGNRTPTGCRMVRDTAVDAQLHYMGTPSGVVDMTTGSILRGEQARHTLTTLMTSVPFDPDATHPMVDKLTSHIREDAAEWFWGALGFALHGRPSRRFLMLHGQDGGEGKSTVIAALASCLGDYYDVIPKEALMVTLSTAGPSPERAFATRARIATLSEPAKQIKKFDSETIKAISGGDAIPYRLLYRNFGSEKKPSVCTMLFACNELPQWDRLDNALSEREKILPYPKPSEPDPDVINTFLNKDKQAAMAMLAKLLRYARTYKDEPPGDTQEIEERRKEEVEASTGTLGEWLLNNLNPYVVGERLLGSDIRKAIEASDVGKLHMSDKRLSQYITTTLKLPPTKTIRTPNGRGKGWENLRLIHAVDGQAHMELQAPLFSHSLSKASIDEIMNHWHQGGSLADIVGTYDGMDLSEERLAQVMKEMMDIWTPAHVPANGGA